MRHTYHTDCRHFDGYRPCRYKRACEGCPHHEPRGPDVLLVNLDALGDVLRTTAVLPAIRRAWPGARITWLTRPRAVPLLAHNPLLDRVLPFGPEALAELGARRFDVLLNADKGPVSGGIAVTTVAADRRGFGIDAAGVVVPLDQRARHLYDMGLDDDLKFRTNDRCAQDLLAQAWGLRWEGDPYTLVLPDQERAQGPRRRVGFNTGCSPQWPHKKLSLDLQARAVERIAAFTGEPVLLLGGPEDTARNAELARRCGASAEPSPTDLGLLRGVAEVDRCDVVFTGDTLGMHVAIARGCHVVAWFGPTCPQEIALYGRGVKLLAEVGCAPCWRSSCANEPMCHDRVYPEVIALAVRDCLAARDQGRPIDEVRGGTWWRPGISGGG